VWGAGRRPSGLPALAQTRPLSGLPFDHALVCALTMMSESLAAAERDAPSTLPPYETQASAEPPQPPPPTYFQSELQADQQRAAAWFSTSLDEVEAGPSCRALVLLPRQSSRDIGGRLECSASPEQSALASSERPASPRLAAVLDAQDLSVFEARRRREDRKNRRTCMLVGVGVCVFVVIVVVIAGGLRRS